MNVVTARSPRPLPIHTRADTRSPARIQSAPAPPDPPKPLLTATSSADSTAQLNAQLRALGLYAADTLGDGNCLFRALADQLYGSPARHMDLRARICDWIERHRARYEPFVEDERGLETHLRCMREHGTYGGHMELSAFAHLTRRNVKVVQPGLVYVIEWAAFASPPSSPKAKPKKHYEYQDDYGYDYDDDEGYEQEVDEGDDDNAHRKKPGSSSKKDKAKKEKNKKGERGRTPAPDATEEEGEGDTIYVAYHDWEHFSSIRNLRGPHTGLPVVREAPAPDVVPSAPVDPKKERKEKARREKETSTSSSASTGTMTGAGKKKVTLKLGSANTSGSGASAGPAPTPPAPAVGVGVAVSEEPIDPAGVPLPKSRAVSPFPSSESSPSSSSFTQAHPQAQMQQGNPHPLRASHLPDQHPDPGSHHHSHSRLPDQQHLHAQPPHAHPHAHPHQHTRATQSPKRALELDPAGDDSECSAASSGSRMKRARAHSRAHPDPDPDHHPSVARQGGAAVNADADVDMDVDVDTPSLSPPSSQSTTTSASSPDADADEADAEPGDTTSSAFSSLASSPEPEIGANTNHTLPAHVPPTPRERPLTRRQRKALGLPKQRAAGAVGKGAGKIVIPGGRFKRSAGVRGVGGEVQEDAGVEKEGEREWTRNGVGRVDVRGFRELKI
ncbi:hypothetical protein H0H81_011774 [Sphagnurus paluster]|uniref:OTU domain-containing protein n=1 Tax=Sphagnurus paluster TaxID=117069 RepID=A0A9P7FNQ2_9AGAR|nr:hypothetical protein H0H81_011774 [Sphagnurus paluster]